MKSFKKTLKLLGLVLLIVLASIGIGIPVPPSNKKDDTIEIKVALFELKDDRSKLAQFDIKQ